MATIDVTVTVDDAHLSSIDTVAAGLRARGLRIDAVHGAIGMISGAVPAERLHDLTEEPGVTAVEESLTYRLPPPDAPLQ